MDPPQLSVQAAHRPLDWLRTTGRQDGLLQGPRLRRLGRARTPREQPAWTQGPHIGTPVRIVAQSHQPGHQPLIADIPRMHRLPGAVPQRVEPSWGTGGNMVRSMVGLGEELEQPEHAHPSQAEPHPGAMGGNMLVQPWPELHPL